MEKQSKLDELQNDKGFKQLTAEEEKQIAGGIGVHFCPSGTHWDATIDKCIDASNGYAGGSAGGGL